MAQAREIRGRIKAVANIQRITKTMQMIATARFQASQRRATAAKPYTSKIAELVGELSSQASSEEAGKGLTHPLLTCPAPAVGRTLVLVLTSNRGLCGGYNANILRLAASYLADHADEKIDIEVVGKKGASYFKFNQISVSKNHEQFGDTPRFEDISVLAQDYMQRFSEGRYDGVFVLYMAFESMSRQVPKLLPLLPLSDPTASDGQAAASSATAGAVGASGVSGVDYEFSPDPEQLLSDLLPLTVKTQLFQCFNEAEVSEQIARMIAMKAATDNAGKMSKELNRIFNRARQTAITTELMEVISGAAALG